MTNQPQTWHYGLMARWWAEFVTDGGDDLAYFQRAVERYGQPALDLGCGAGRLLIPMRQAGLDVDGCDISADMIALCRRRADRDGVAPALSVQPMHKLDLPRTYQTIYICGSFGIGGRREHDREALRRCYHQLAPGGTLVFDHHLPYEDPNEWRHWLPEERAKLPEPWPEPGPGDRRRAANGDELERLFRLVDIDPLAQRETRQVRASLWREGRLIAQEEHTIELNPYFCREVLLFLELAGFTDIAVYGRHSEQPATPEDRAIVFVARKTG
jgi:SAM-dependent methyltransferase